MSSALRSTLVAVVAMFACALAVATSCTVNHKSGDYACTIQSDCNSGRQCIDGFCIVPGSIDAPGPGTDGRPGDSSSCPSGCTSCNVGTKTCNIDCSMANGACNNKVNCPAGWNCNVDCNTESSCRSGVSCTGTLACDVTCSAKNSCDNVVCGTGKCNVECSGVQSCKSVQCGASCACDVSCFGSQSCQDVACTAPACELVNGCSSTISPACRSCP